MELKKCMKIIKKNDCLGILVIHTFLNVIFKKNCLQELNLKNILLHIVIWTIL